MKKILVTGGTGFIGSHTVVELINAGYEPILVDDQRNSQDFILNRLEQIVGRSLKLYKIDCADYEKLTQVFLENPDLTGVIHFAADKAVGESVEDPLKYFENNIQSTVNVLRCMKEASVKSFVFSSSCTVYGIPDVIPVDENAPIKPANSPYGDTKQICERLVRYAEASPSQKLSVSLLRYFNPIGAHESGLIGELPIGVPNNLVPFITQTAIGKRKELSVFGDDYDTPDGTCIRDYIHVVDLAKAHVAALGFNDSQGEGVDVFNIGVGKGSSVLEVINTFEEVSSQKLNWKFAPRREGDVPQIFADAQKAYDLLNWKTELSLADGLKSSWVWENNLHKEGIEIT